MLVNNSRGGLIRTKDRRITKDRDEGTRAGIRDLGVWRVSFCKNHHSQQSLKGELLDSRVVSIVGK